MVVFYFQPFLVGWFFFCVRLEKNHFRLVWLINFFNQVQTSWESIFRVIVAHIRTFPRSYPNSIENGWKSVRLRNVNHINPNQLQLKWSIPIEHDQYVRNLATHMIRILVIRKPYNVQVCQYLPVEISLAIKSTCSQIKLSLIVATHIILIVYISCKLKFAHGAIKEHCFILCTLYLKFQACKAMYMKHAFQLNWLELSHLPMYSYKQGRGTGKGI